MMDRCLTYNELNELKEIASETAPGPWYVGVWAGSAYAVFTRCDQEPEPLVRSIGGISQEVRYVARLEPGIITALVNEVLELRATVEEFKQAANEELKAQIDWLVSKLQGFCDSAVLCVSCPYAHKDCHNNEWRKSAKKVVSRQCEK